jgi:hypothetical protein
MATNLFLDFETGQYFVAESDDIEAGLPPSPVPSQPTPTVRLPSGRAAIEEAGNIVERTCELLLAMPKKESGRVGSDLRAACNYLRAYAERMLAFASDQFPVRLAFCFQLARESNATVIDFENARIKLTDEKPVSLLAFAVKQAAIRNCLESAARVLLGIRFRSRQDVEKVQVQMREAFAQAMESAADDMEQETYQALTSLASAVQFHLYDSARPLPKMVRFQFGNTAPSLIFAYRLYQNAARASELRSENKNIHPAFFRRTGRALSA